MGERATIVDLIEDAEHVASDLRALLVPMGLDVRTHATVGDYLAGYDPTRSGCLMCSIRLPGSSGRKLQQHLNFIDAPTPVVLVGVSEDMGLAVDAIQLGAFDYLELPLDHFRLNDCVQRALDYDTAQREQTQRLGRIWDELCHPGGNQRRSLQAAAAAMRHDPQLNRFSDFLAELARTAPALASRRLH
jgi:FixJ family two-component response regulator